MIMKKILLLSAVIFASVAARAQDPTVVQNVNFSMPTNGTAIPTWTIAASTTTNVGLVADVSKQAAAAWQITCKLATAGTNGTQLLTFDRSNDGTTWSSTNNTTVYFIPTGTTLFTLVTNIPSQSAQFVRLKSWQNLESDATAPVTNAAVGYLIKTHAP